MLRACCVFIWSIFDPIFEMINRNVFLIGRFFYFLVETMSSMFKRPYRWHELFIQMEFVGNRSVFIICLTGLFTGLAVSFQIHLGFQIVNATSLVGPTVAMGIARELGPVLTGLIVAARAGGAMAANLGSMKVTEQIDALKVMGVMPKQYLVLPRVLAGTIIMPFLNIVFVFTAMLGSYLLIVKVLNLDEAMFWSKTLLWLEPKHIYEGMIKATIFGFFFSAICCFNGYSTKGGARGVGQSTNLGVVWSMVTIIILDFFIMNFIDIFYKLVD